MSSAAIEPCPACRAGLPGSCSCRWGGWTTRKGIDFAGNRPPVPRCGAAVPPVERTLRPYCPGISHNLTPVTEAPPMAMIDNDPQDTRVALVMGRRVYLGTDKLRRLFWQLAQPLGRAHQIADLQKLMDGFATDAGLVVPPDELRKAHQRMRQHLCRIGKALAENGADGHLVIMRRRGEVWLQARYIEPPRQSLSARRASSYTT